MSLRERFEQIAAFLSERRDAQDIRSLEAIKALAQQGYVHVASRDGVALGPISPEKSKEIIERCDRDLLKLTNKNKLTL